MVMISLHSVVVVVVVVVITTTHTPIQYNIHAIFIPTTTTYIYDDIQNTTSIQYIYIQYTYNM